MRQTLPQAVESYLAECFATRSEPRLKELAGLLDEPAYRLTRRFACEYGMNLGAYMRKRQLAHAQQLLRGDMSLDEVARACGFTHRRTFFRAFRRELGITPLAFRKKCP